MEFDAALFVRLLYAIMKCKHCGNYFVRSNKSQSIHCQGKNLMSLYSGIINSKV